MKKPDCVNLGTPYVMCAQHDPTPKDLVDPLNPDWPLKPLTFWMNSITRELWALMDVTPMGGYWKKISWSKE